MIIENCRPPKEMEDVCFVTHALKAVSGKWKVVILWYLHEKKLRFNAFQKLMPEISRGTLARQLKELEENHLILKKDYHELPLKVEYSLTEKGKEYIAILQEMKKWSMTL